MKGIVLICCLLLCISCASYKPKLTKDIKTDLTQSKIVNFGSEYGLLSYRTYNEKTSFDKSNPKSIFENLKDTISKIETLNNLMVELSFENKNILSIRLRSENRIIKQSYFRGEIKKNGFFHLDKKIKNCNGIPYLLGGCYIEKTRIGIAKNGDLIIEKAIDNYGAFLFVIGFGGQQHNIYLYKKTN